MNIEALFTQKPYSLSKETKHTFLAETLNLLINHHKTHCLAYHKILSATGIEHSSFSTIEDMPFLSVRLFKDFALSSVQQTQVIKTLTSSGTTSQRLSQITLDKETALYQTRALVNIVQDFIGKKRLPMLIIDSESIIRNRQTHSARGAGILGISNFGKDHTYLLDEQMVLNVDTLERFLSVHKDEDILIFGFTFMVWSYLYKRLKEIGKSYDLGRATLIHSGGWKKLSEQAVDNITFKAELKQVCNLGRIYNFYGMVEQVGSIFMECTEGFLHAPNFADIIVRQPYDWSCAPFNTNGIVEVLSILPHSYPGHILLTEDLGMIYGEDTCKCGRMGKYFHIEGRLPKAELRGCSDTHAYSPLH
ncbi:MAG: hypothetical protein L3V56_01920 [Candidatus Magnetoovum sp. WYHC-5]|nr:hypothetical protein [Candidatus Magnetoovum sp. WYHC-5]